MLLIYDMTYEESIVARRDVILIFVSDELTFLSFFFFKKTFVANVIISERYVVIRELYRVFHFLDRERAKVNFNCIGCINNFRNI